MALNRLTCQWSFLSFPGIGFQDQYRACSLKQEEGPWANLAVFAPDTRSGRGDRGRLASICTWTFPSALEGKPSQSAPRIRRRLLMTVIGKCTPSSATSGTLWHFPLYTSPAVFQRWCHSSGYTPYPSKSHFGSVHPHRPPGGLRGTSHCTLPWKSFWSVRKSLFRNYVY